MKVKKKENLPESAGIYKLTCNNNGKIYIGKSINLLKRLSYYEKYILKNFKEDSLLKRAIIKHGWESFTIEILETFEEFNKTEDNNMLLERESYYIELFDSTNRCKGYNVCKFSIDRTGLKHSEETKQKMSKKRLGIILSEETKERISKAHIGKILSTETKQKMSIAQLGNTKALGHTMTHSEETKKQISDSHKGKVLSDETKDKIKKANVGRKHSEETKQKIRESTKLAKAVENKAELRSSA